MLSAAFKIKAVNPQILSLLLPSFGKNTGKSMLFPSRESLSVDLLLVSISSSNVLVKIVSTSSGLAMRWLMSPISLSIKPNTGVTNVPVIAGIV